MTDGTRDPGATSRKFRIRYIDPETGEIAEIVQEFTDTPASKFLPPGASTVEHGPISALEWAEDSAYSLSDKGWYEVTEIRR